MRLTGATVVVATAVVVVVVDIVDIVVASWVVTKVL